MANKKELLRQLPSVDEVLKTPEVKNLCEIYPRILVVEAIRQELDDIRTAFSSGSETSLKTSFDLPVLISKVKRDVEEASAPSLKRVINATGVVVHTNLGRSILSKKAIDAIVVIASGYSNLEFDVKSGERGSRHVHVSSLLCKLTGAEAAMAVNNNASAVLLALSTLAAGRGAIVSRGQLVEIGGSFRIPDVMRQSGAILKEVGTTNKTYISDFRDAITENTALLMRVHPSNFRVVGFSKEVSLEELVSLGREFNLPVLDDLGSGVLVDLSPYSLPEEPTAQSSIKAGADVVTFSGDKLLGGPQAGLILGKKKYVSLMEKHPLARAIRVDKFTLAALEATLSLYLEEEKALQEIPTLHMLTMSQSELKKTADRLAREIRTAVGQRMIIDSETDVSKAGGGSLPLAELPTAVVSIKPLHMTVNELEQRLRSGKPPILARIKEDKLLLDVRTIQESEDEAIIASLKQLSSGKS
ncbi:MAG: L-seryl-tRNA(Sec) selenium transferase [Actinomycetota bacterium]